MADRRAAAEAALAAVDKVMAEKPKRIGHDFSEATKRLTAYRRILLDGWGGPPSDAADRQLLSRLNAIISVVYGAHYPIGAPKWEPLAQARDELAALARSEED